MLNMVSKQLNSLTLLSMIKMKALGHHPFTLIILATISKTQRLISRVVYTGMGVFPIMLMIWQ